MMKKEDIQQFLASSLLEEYVLGSIDPSRIPEVENYISNVPEVKAAYDALQDNIALLASKVAAPPPPGTKENILRAIDQSIVPPTNTKEVATKVTNNSSRIAWGMFAASLIGIVAIGAWGMSLSANNTKLTAEKAALESQYAILKDQCEEKQAIYAQQEAQWEMLGAAKTKKLLISGKDEAAALQTVAYRNEDSRASYLHVLSLPKLPPGKCLQLWADVDGKMLSLAVLPKETGQVIKLPFKENATSLNITIEPDGGSLHPTVKDLIASVTI